MSNAPEELKGLPVPLSTVDDSGHRGRLIAPARLRAQDQRTVFALMIGLSVVVCGWLWFGESGQAQSEKKLEKPTRELRFLVELNNAPRNEFLQLPGIGATLADRIVEHREQVTPFEDVTDLEKIKGIGVKKREGASPYVYITNKDM